MITSFLYYAIRLHAFNSGFRHRENRATLYMARQSAVEGIANRVLLGQSSNEVPCACIFILQFSLIINAYSVRLLLGPTAVSSSNKTLETKEAAEGCPQRKEHRSASCHYRVRQRRSEGYRRPCPTPCEGNKNMIAESTSNSE